ncbi:MAG: LPXTG cell wall anchor domain-containing protein [Clostridiales bacterium]|nr:LPXTG cell wall anchor domain-containing protein [Clostridiales bacterium]
MKTTLKTVYRILPYLLALIMIFAMTVTAYAADTASLDFDQTGSIELTLADSDGNAVSGGAVTLYQVAILYLDDGNMVYEYADAFNGCEITLDVEDTSLAATLAAYVEDSDISGTTASIGSGGTVSFTDLELGLYLIIQTTDSDNYETINPFVVTVPIDNDGEWVYTVDASPKVGEVTTIESESESTSTSKTSKNSTSTVSTLPKTGQLNWPVWLMAGGSSVLLLFGWALRRSGNKQEEYEK